MTRKNTFIVLFSSISILSCSMTFAAGYFYQDDDLGLTNESLVYRMGGGYQFNSYFGLEGSYVLYPNAQTNLSTMTNSNKFVHVAAKGVVPLRHDFNIYGKAGAARISDATLNGIINNSASNLSGIQTKVLPYLGAGVGYNINQKVDFNMQFAQTPKSGAIPTMYSATAGFSYKF